MKKGLLIGFALILLSAMFSGCPKQAKISKEEAGKRDLVVMFHGEPECLVWSLERVLAVSTALGTFTGGIGTAAGFAAEHEMALQSGKKIVAALPDYQAGPQSAHLLLKEILAVEGKEITVVCSEPHGITEDCVPVGSYDELKSRFPGRAVLVVEPYEYGLRSRVPYFMAVAGLYDIDSEGQVWSGRFALLNQDIGVQGKSLDDWLADKENMLQIIEQQMVEVGKRISNSVTQGYSSKGNNITSCRTNAPQDEILKLSDFFKSEQKQPETASP